METKKNIGIWMDHATAHFINLNTEKNNYSITSNFSFDIKEAALRKSEKIMHNTEQQMQETYYKEIAEKILRFNHVLLFGPTNAKTELHNYLKKDLHFKDIKIDIKSTDQMTDNEKDAFVKKHFKN